MMITVSLPERSWIDEIGDLPGVRSFHWDPRVDEHPSIRPDVFVAPYVVGIPPLELAGRIPGLRLMQLLSAGFDGILEVVPESVTVCNAGPVHDDSTAELAVALTLAAQRGIPESVRAAARGAWEHRTRPSLADRRVLLVGYGGVGRAIAARLQAFGVRMVAVARHARDGDGLVDQVRPVDELGELLPSAEVVIVAVPLNPQTVGMVGEGFLRLVPDGALVVNIARGQVADTAAILRHAGRLRFALDVTDPEPLPTEHPLWSAPDVLITPHLGGDSSAFLPRVLAMLRDQLGRLARGESALYVVRAGTG